MVIRPPANPAPKASPRAKTPAGLAPLATPSFNNPLPGRKRKVTPLLKAEPGPVEFRERALAELGQAEHPYQAAYLTPWGEWVNAKNPLQGRPTAGKNHDFTANALLKTIYGEHYADPHGSLPLYHLMRESGMMRVDARPQKEGEGGQTVPAELVIEAGGHISPEQVAALKSHLMAESKKNGSPPVTNWAIAYPMTPGFNGREASTIIDEINSKEDGPGGMSRIEGQGIDGFENHPLTQDLMSAHHQWRSQQPEGTMPPLPAGYRSPPSLKEAQAPSRLAQMDAKYPQHTLPIHRQFLGDVWSNAAPEHRGILTKKAVFRVATKGRAGPVPISGRRVPSQAFHEPSRGSRTEVEAKRGVFFGVLKAQFPEQAAVKTRFGTGKEDEHILEDHVYDWFSVHPDATPEQIREHQKLVIPNTGMKRGKKETKEAFEYRRAPWIGRDPWDRHFMPISAPTMLRLAEVALKQWDWYRQFGGKMAEVVGPENVNEAFAILGLTSAQASPKDNVVNTIRTMGIVRKMMKEEGRGWDWTGDPDLSTNPTFKEFTRRVGAGSGELALELGEPKVPRKPPSDDQVEKLWKFYQTGEVDQGGPKTPAFAINFHSARERLWDILSTMDTWALKPMGFGTLLDPRFPVNTENKQARGRWFPKVAPTEEMSAYGRGVYKWLSENFGRIPNQIQSAVWVAAQGIDDLLRANPELANLSDEEHIEQAVGSGLYDRQFGELSGGYDEAFENADVVAVRNHYGPELIDPAGNTVVGPNAATQADLQSTYSDRSRTKKNPEWKYKKRPYDITQEYMRGKRAEELPNAPRFALPLGVEGVHGVDQGEALAHRDAIYEALEVDPETGKSALLDRMGYDHQFHPDFVHHAEEGGLRPHIEFSVLAANREAVHQVAAYVGNELKLARVRAHQADPWDNSHGGVRYWGEEGEDLVSLAAQMGKLGTRTEIEGDILRFPDYNEELLEHTKRVAEHAAAVGLDRERLGHYAGFHANIEEVDYPGHIEAIRNTYGLPGRPGLQDASPDLPAAPREGPLEGAGADGDGLPVTGVPGAATAGGRGTAGSGEPGEPGAGVAATTVALTQAHEATQEPLGALGAKNTADVAPGGKPVAAGKPVKPLGPKSTVSMLQKCMDLDRGRRLLALQKAVAQSIARRA